MGLIRYSNYHTQLKKKSADIAIIFVGLGARKHVSGVSEEVDWLQSLKQFFINVSYHILVASLTLMALFKAYAYLLLYADIFFNSLSFCGDLTSANNLCKHFVRVYPD